MIHLLESFGCGLAFAFGAFAGVTACCLFQKRDRAEIIKELKASHERVENRLAAQVGTMVACLEEIRKNKTSK
jgi:hypothetical protein